MPQNIHNFNLLSVKYSSCNEIYWKRRK